MDLPRNDMKKSLPMPNRLAASLLLGLSFAIPAAFAGSSSDTSSKTASPAGAAKAAKKTTTFEEPELLDPEVAFRFSAKLLDAKTLEVRYAIADGYYMYRDKFKFNAAEPAELGKANVPKGDVKDDPNFGRVETYRKSVTVKLPVSRLPADGKIALTVVSQGCADVGVCYPPMTSRATLDLKGPATDAPAPKPLSSILKKP
jgi:thiol:disulfide interchange protein